MAGGDGQSRQSLSDVVLWLPLFLQPSFGWFSVIFCLPFLVYVLYFRKDFFFLSFFFFRCLVLLCENVVLWWPFVLPT